MRHEILLNPLEWSDRNRIIAEQKKRGFVLIGISGPKHQEINEKYFYGYRLLFEQKGK